MNPGETKVDKIYKGLKTEILNGEYTYGDKLVISQIAERYEVSNIPVREALRKMASEGYIKFYTNQGAVISGYSKASMIDTMQVKAVLEGYATRLSIDYMTKDDIDELYAKNALFEAASLNDDPASTAYNIEFHMTIYGKNPNKELYNTIQLKWDKWQIAKALLPVRLAAPAAASDHNQILQLIGKKDYEGCEMFVRRHKLNVGYGLIELLK